MYDYYGMTTHEIEVLFVVGFGSSMVFGTLIGSFADKYGRRANCVLYGILYGLACVTKHFNNFYILMVGRLLGGVATSILYSAFESWLIYEHNKRGFSEELLASIFSHAVLGNSLVAIVAGVSAQQVANYAGYVAPFDMSLIVLVIMIFVILRNWSENYGDVTVQPLQGFKNALSAIREDHKVLYLGLIQSLFEGAMYTFVLEWTPALTPHSESAGDPPQEGISSGDEPKATIPHGYIFAAFMVAIMIGSSLFKILTRYTSVESFMRPVLLISAMSLAVPIIYPGNQLFIFCGFLVFEIGVGLFWPAMGTMRGKYVPEATRATIMNIFRVPLNLIVVIILTQNLPMDVIFQCCVVFLIIASLCQQFLFRLSGQVSSSASSSSTTSFGNNDNDVEKDSLTNLSSPPVSKG